MKRKSNIELSRIMAIAFILLSHFSLWSHWQTDQQSSLNYLVTMLYQPLGKFGVYIFVLITCYFSLKENQDVMSYERKQLKHSFITMQEVWFYSFLIFGITWLFNIIQPSLGDVVWTLLPFISREYWFVTAYIMLVLLIPFFNVLSVKLNFTEHLSLILILMFFDTLSLVRNYTMNGYLASFVVVYFIGTFIRKYLKRLAFIKNWMLVTSFGLLWIIELISMVLLDRLNYGSDSVHFTDKLFAFLGATALFILILRSKTFYNKWINRLAKTVFAGYLLTDNPFTRHFVWDNIFQTFKFQYTPWLPIYGLGCVALIILVTIPIDVFRIWFIQKLNAYFQEKKMSQNKN